MCSSAAIRRTAVMTAGLQNLPWYALKRAALGTKRGAREGQISARRTKELGEVLDVKNE
jgi:hypothetical protein